MKTTLTLISIMLVGASIGTAQIPTTNPANIKTLTIFQPKLALLGAEKITTNGKDYHKIVLTVTNRDKLDPKSFEISPGVQLPPNPCGDLKVRFVLQVYGSDRRSYLKCFPVRIASYLKSPSFLIEKGKPIPEFVNVVLADLQTGVSYKSNWISPSTGASK